LLQSGKNKTASSKPRFFRRAKDDNEFKAGRSQVVDRILTRCVSFEVALFKTVGDQRDENKGNYLNPTREF
jgi:hypothetical protein